MMIFLNDCSKRFPSFDAIDIEEHFTPKFRQDDTAPLAAALQVNIRYEGRPVSGWLKPSAFLAATEREPGADLSS